MGYLCSLSISNLQLIQVYEVSEELTTIFIARSESLKPMALTGLELGGISQIIIQQLLIFPTEISNSRM